MDWKNRICWGCEHYCNNNDDDLKMGCHAFPKGILDEIGSKHSHDKIIKGQVGNYVYSPSNRKINRRGNKIEIYQ